MVRVFGRGATSTTREEAMHVGGKLVFIMALSRREGAREGTDNV